MADRFANSNTAIYQDFKLYIEGEECPFQSISIRINSGSIPEMVVSLAPYDIVRNLKERTRVHLYFSDPLEPGTERLLFDGEIAGEGYVRSGGSRNLTYAVTHVSLYLAETLVHFKDPNLNVLEPGLFSKGLRAGRIVPNVDIKDAYNSNIDGFFKANHDDVHSMNGYFRKFIKDQFIMAKDIAGNEQKTMSFYREKMRLWKLLERIAVLPPADKKEKAEGGGQISIEDFAGEGIYSDATREIVRMSGGLLSIWQLFGILFRNIFYLQTVITSPLYSSQGGSQLLQSILFKPHDLFALPPRCNVVWPSMCSSFSFNRDFKSAPTRVYSHILTPVRGSDDEAEKGEEYNLLNNILWAPSKFFGFDLRETSGKDVLNDTLTDEEQNVGVRVSRSENNGWFSRYISYLFNEGDFRLKAESLIDYEFIRQKYQTSTAVINMVFNPYIVPDFPCLIMDQPDSGMHVYGYVTSISHDIDVLQGSSTSINIAYMRRYDETLDASVRFPVADESWLNDNTAYRSMLGVGSIQESPYSEVNVAFISPDRAIGFRLNRQYFDFPKDTVVDDAVIKSLRERKVGRIAVYSGSKNGDIRNITRSFDKAMRSKIYNDNIYNAYNDIKRPIVDRKQYDEFMGSGFRRSTSDEVRFKIGEYRDFIRNRMGAPVGFS